MSKIKDDAVKGDTGAQFLLGNMYYNGEGMPQDYAEAVKWYRLAADKGHVKAQYNLGVMHGTGIGVPRNHAEAVKWYRLAADQGDAKAQYNLGVSDRNGLGVLQDYKEVVKLFRLAATRGYEFGLPPIRELRCGSSHTPSCRNDRSAALVALIDLV